MIDIETCRSLCYLQKLAGDLHEITELVDRHKVMMLKKKNAPDLLSQVSATVSPAAVEESKDHELRVSVSNNDS